jgi:hypothetical protein
MFAPPVAKLNAKTAAPSKDTSPLHRSTAFAHRRNDGSAEYLRMLQQTIGNQAVLRLLGRQDLLENKHGDPGEDIGPESVSAEGGSRGLTWDFSKIPIFRPQRTDGLQPAPPFSASRLPGFIQAKLKVGAVDDPLEHEADRVGDQVMRMPSPEVAPTCAPPQISRKCAACAEEEENLQRKEAGTAEASLSEAPASVHQVLLSPGQPLDPSSQAYFEPRFGHDFSRVRIHSGTTAEQSARDVKASAYTVGNNIVFATGQFAPGTQEGRRLIAHELAHVVQQSASTEIGSIDQHRQNRSLSSIVAQVSAHQTLRRQPISTNAICELTPQQELGPSEWLRCLYAGHIRENDTYPLRIRENGVVATEAELLKWAIRQRFTEELAIRHVMNSHDFAGNEQARAEARGRLLWAFAEDPQWQKAKQQWKEEQEAEEARRLEEIKQEIARLQKEEAIQRFPGHIDPRKYPGTVPHGMAFVSNPTVMAVLNMLSILIYFIPVVGEARAIVEAIIGRNLLTGEKLDLLDRLLSALPLAPLVLKGGKLVIRGVSVVVTTATEKAALILAIAKNARKEPVEILALLSRLEQSAAHIETIREARAAVAEGRELNAAQMNALTEVDEALQGGKAAPHPGEPARPSEPTAKPKPPETGGTPLSGGRFGPPRKVNLRGQYHDLMIGRIGNLWSFLLCSGACGPLIDKARAMLAKVAKSDPAYHEVTAELRTLINEAKQADTWVNDVLHVVEEGQQLNEAQREIKRLEAILEGIQARHPDAIVPDIVPEATVRPPEEVAPVAEPAGAAAVEAGPRLRPDELDPPGTQYKEPVSGLTGKEGATDIPSWVKNEGYPSPRVGERSQDYAARILDHKYGVGKWKRGPGEEYSQIEKWARRHFE